MLARSPREDSADAIRLGHNGRVAHGVAKAKAEASQTASRSGGLRDDDKGQAEGEPVADEEQIAEFTSGGFDDRC